jgi:hypothetical protein
MFREMFADDWGVVFGADFADEAVDAEGYVGGGPVFRSVLTPSLF